MSELLENMILLCGEPELDGLNDPAARLRALIDGLITQRNRADAAEAEIARLKEALQPFARLAQHVHRDAPNEGALVLTTTDGGIIDTSRSRQCTVADLRVAADAMGLPLAKPAQPPAVGEDVVERAKAAVMEAYADYWGLSGDELPDNCAVAITDALIRSNLLRTKDAG